MKTYLIDLDGTIYHGNKLNKNAKEFIEYLQKNNYDFYFFTNNARRTQQENVEHLEKLGIYGIKKEQFFTSAIACASYIAKYSNKRRAYMLGEAGLKEALIKYKFELVENNADYVFVGLDILADYEKYSQALTQILNGAILVGTNIDRRIPNDEGVKVGNGGIVKMLEYCSECESMPMGKPYASYMEMALDYTNKCKEEVIILGDNLETDILCGVNYGVDTILYTQGVHGYKDIEKLNIKPTYIIDDLNELIK